jgi:hypothetical protein
MLSEAMTTQNRMVHTLFEREWPRMRAAVPREGHRLSACVFAAVGHLAVSKTATFDTRAPATSSSVASLPGCPSTMLALQHPRLILLRRRTQP